VENKKARDSAWQPEKFADGSTINIYDFEVIE